MMKRPETVNCDTVFSLPCLSRNLALLFHFRVDKYKGALYCSHLPLLLERAVECYTVFTVNVSNGHSVAKPTVVSLQSSDPISQQQLAVDGSLSRNSPPGLQTLHSPGLLQSPGSPTSCPPPGVGEGLALGSSLPLPQLISFSHMTLNIISI